MSKTSRRINEWADSQADGAGMTGQSLSADALALLAEFPAAPEVGEAHTSR